MHRGFLILYATPISFDTFPTAKDRRAYIENAHIPIIDTEMWKKSLNDTGKQTQTDQKPYDKHLLGSALLCRLRGKTQLSNGKRICVFPLLHV